MSEIKYNKDLEAYNVFELDIDFDKAVELTSGVVPELNKRTLYGEDEKAIHLEDVSPSLYVEIPHWNGDISWVSAASKEAFDFFDNCFSELKIEEKTREIAELDFPLIMYSGFFVVRSVGKEPHFHMDYISGCEDKAFTIMMPIQIDESSKTGHLLYYDDSGELRQYKYKKGKGVSFGSLFFHSTEPFQSDEKFIFLCFTYGTDDPAYWEFIKSTAASQGVSYRNSDGEICVKNPNFEKYF